MRVIIIIIISLFNVDTKNKVKNYNKKRNYSLYNNPAVMETMFSWLIMVTHGYFMVMFLYSILMVKSVTIVQQKHG